MVPFRQCKLTELLFSNSFPGSNHTGSSSSLQQKAIMVVTADPVGDFNATKEIMRYSALAREVTVPRVPSVTSQILSHAAAYSARPGSSSSNHSGSHQANEEALAEIARLNDTLEILQLSLESERARREAAEQSWLAAEEKLSVVEEEVREECFASFEQTLQLEKRRWEAAWMNAREEGAGMLDRKIEILEKTMESNDESLVQIHEDTEEEAGKPSSDVAVVNHYVGDLEKENEDLKAKVAEIEKQLANSRTPSGASKKHRVLKAKRWEAETTLEVFD
jgi:chromosome segregation ATPase